MHIRNRLHADARGKDGVATRGCGGGSGDQLVAYRPAV